ncbi:MAG: ABC transporter ATP-binding protein, partial [Proteobacteria bacterium]
MFLRLPSPVDFKNWWRLCNSSGEYTVRPSVSLRLRLLSSSQACSEIYDLYSYRTFVGSPLALGRRLTLRQTLVSIMAQDTLQAKPFRFYFRKHPRVFFLGSLSLFITNFLDVLTPLAVKFAIDAVTAKDSSKLLQAILVYIAVMAGVALFRFGWRYYFGRFHHSVAEDLRNRIFGKLTELGPSFYQRSPVGQLMSLMTNDVNSFRMAIGPGMLTLLDALFLLAMILPIMIWLSWDWTWKTLIFIPLIPFIMRKLESAIHTRYREEQDRLAEVSANTQEIVSGVRVIKGFAQEKNQLETFNLKSKEYEVACNRVVAIDALFHPSFQGAIILGGVSLLWFGTPDVMKGTITLGSFVAFHDYVRRMVWPFSAIGMAASMME